MLKEIKHEIETTLKECVTKYVCEVGGDGETETDWEWITDKKKKKTSCGEYGYINAVFYNSRLDNYPRNGTLYTVNSIDNVEYPTPNITLYIYKKLQKEEKQTVKAKGKKELIMSIKKAIDLNILECSTVNELIEIVVKNVIVEDEAQKMIKTYYGDYVDWVGVNYNVDDIDYETLQKAINDAIYNASIKHLYRMCDDDYYLGNEEDNPDDYKWRIDDYNTLESDIKYNIVHSLGLE